MQGDVLALVLVHVPTSQNNYYSYSCGMFAVIDNDRAFLPLLPQHGQAYIQGKVTITGLIHRHGT